MSLYNKHRPLSFSDVVGNEQMIASLQPMIEDPSKSPHSFLLSGPTGTGKTTIARIVANELGADTSQIIEIDSAQFRGIDTVRDIRKQSQYAPLYGGIRVWIIDEVHQLSKDAQNGMLKILEDTPKHIYFILCTTEPQKLLPTIVGRCSHHTTKVLTDKEMFELLRSVVKAEGELLTKEIYRQIINDSFGHPRNALTILQKVLFADGEQRMEVAKQTAEEQSQSIELCRALLRGAGWKEVALILRGLKDQDAEGIRRHVLGYSQAVLLKSSNDKAAQIIEELFEPLYNIGFPGLVLACYAITNE